MVAKRDAGRRLAGEIGDTGFAGQLETPYGVHQPAVRSRGPPPAVDPAEVDVAAFERKLVLRCVRLEPAEYTRAGGQCVDHGLDGDGRGLLSGEHMVWRVRVEHEAPSGAPEGHRVADS